MNPSISDFLRFTEFRIFEKFFHLLVHGIITEDITNTLFFDYGLSARNVSQNSILDKKCIKLSVPIYQSSIICFIGIFTIGIFDVTTTLTIVVMLISKSKLTCQPWEF